MAEANATATPPAPSGGLTLEQVNAAIASAVKAATEPLMNELTALKTAAAQAPAAQAKDAQTLTLEDVRKTVADALAQHNTTAAAAAARNAFIADKMKGIPAIYAERLPQTGDAAALAAAEQTIRAQYVADMKAAGFTVSNISGAQPAAGQGAVEVAGTIDTSKMTGAQLLALGVKGQTATVATPEQAKALA